MHSATEQFAHELAKYGYTKESNTRIWAALTRSGRLLPPEVVATTKRDDLAILIAGDDGGGWQVEAVRVKLAAAQALQALVAPAVPAPAAPTAPTLRDDGIEVAYRAAAGQLSKRTKKQVVQILLRRFPESERASVGRLLGEVLDSDLGEAMVAVLLSLGLPRGAQMLGQRGPKIERLAHELRLQAGTTAAGLLADELLDALAPLTEILRQLPEPREPGRMNASGPSVNFGAEKAEVPHA